MGERKVLNKHYPDDFDPAKIPRLRQPKNRQIVVRVMLPMSIRCGTCGTYISKGTKFNSRKEDAAGEAYLGIRIHRFYIKCTRCSAEIAFKTDPRNSDYTVESGASRNFEPWREAEAVVDKEKRKRAAEEMGDTMRALENRATDSKRDMDVLADLEETRSIKSRHEGVSIDRMLGILNHSSSTAHHQNLEEGNTVLLAEKDEELVRSITFRNSEGYVKRIEVNDEDFLSEIINESSESALDHPTDVLVKANDPESANKEEVKESLASKMPKLIVKPKSSAAANPQKKHKSTESPAVHDDVKAPVAEEKIEASEEKTNILHSLFQYDSDESDE
ncbi:hypothetical protein CFC21_044738 [Triticum aestivum]|uniref:Splicing factor YJU2 n=2 Tax=Triticum aestivum TaxID=4565 RepID=A0A9R1JY01_WHEAT|nr:splicing factor YJU2-like [Triticum aestivum]KAF7033652.1 hypothetical protein CFC21_044738 [Triticum aestivum]CDM86835.1 unnamed protein product [Triticum aestivum]